MTARTGTGCGYLACLCWKCVREDDAMQVSLPKAMGRCVCGLRRAGHEGKARLSGKPDMVLLLGMMV
jgi:hypothetical protein